MQQQKRPLPHFFLIWLFMTGAFVALSFLCDKVFGWHGFNAHQIIVAAGASAAYVFFIAVAAKMKR